MSEPLLTMTGIVKAFPGVRALDGVDLDVRPGEVHCLLGQNGAGKSTLIKVLAGVHQPDEGVITWRGAPTRLVHPLAAMRLGVATIYQELDLVDGLTVAENVYLGHEDSRAGLLRPAAAREATAVLLRRLGHPEIPPGREVGRLSAAGKQIVSMARALSHDARLIVMDEPSAVLDAGEVDKLFAVIRDLTAEGIAVVYISHRLEEIRQIGDRVTVLKDGRTVSTGLSARETPTAELIRLMTGRSIEYVFPAAQPVRESAPVVLEVEGLSRGASSTTSASRCAPARSSAWPAWSARAGRRCSRRSTARAAPRRAPSGSTASRCAPARSALPCAPAWGWRRRSARARAWCSRTP
jgi:ribose transport system ATP-binding protein